MVLASSTSGFIVVSVIAKISCVVVGSVAAEISVTSVVAAVVVVGFRVVVIGGTTEEEIVVVSVVVV